MAEPLYRVRFMQQETVYEVYARYVSEESLMGFIEIEELVFSEPVQDESSNEALLKAEFKNVQRSYLPMHTLLRIDEVTQSGQARVESKDSVEGNVSRFPSHVISIKDKEDKE